MLLKYFLIAAFGFYTSGVMAWGNEGHKTIALIAEATLTPHAEAQVKTLLALEGHKSLGEIASWADEIKGQEPGLVHHTVRIPFDADDYNPKRDCSGKGKCVVFGIEHFKGVLSDKNMSPANKLRALKFVVHFVGDVHQPLHAISGIGRMPVQIGRHDYTLHKVWDTIAIRRMKTTPAELARQLLANHDQVQQLTPVDWAMESHEIAKRYIFGGDKQRADIRHQMLLPKDYIQHISPILRQRLAEAGLRLGAVLNDVFK